MPESAKSAYYFRRKRAATVPLQKFEIHGANSAAEPYTTTTARPLQFGDLHDRSEQTQPCQRRDKHRRPDIV